jgi:TolB-like protein/class 3 adenylate cyclase
MAKARVERRLAAVLAADVVGYSRLVEQDEASTLAAIKDLREQAIDPLLAEHKGRIVKLMGDGAIMEFASVVDAVACAVAVQKAVADGQAKSPPGRRIVFRIGVNLGDLVVEGDDLLGDGVNVAARLEQLCEPGGVLVSGTAFDHLQGRLGLPLEFTGEQQVKNIARPVRVYRVRLDGGGRRRLGGRRLRPRLPLTAATSLLVLVVAAVGLWWFWPHQPAFATQPSVAVLPFANLGGDEATGRLADGINEDIITDLSRFRELDVIAQSSTAVYKGKPTDVREIARALNVRYVLEGSIQRQGDQVRVTTQLIDATTGTHVWSERWDRPAADVFAVQTEIAEQAASRIGGGGAIPEAESRAARRARPADRAFRLNPNAPGWAHGSFSYAYFMAGRYDDAVRSMERQPLDSLDRGAFVMRAALYAALDRIDDAHRAVADTLGRYPDLTIEGFVSDPGYNDVERGKFMQAMRKAGFPACASADVLAGLAKPVRLPECAQLRPAG